MNDTQKWWQSRTVWTALITGLAGLAGILGHHIAAADQTALIDGVTAASAAVGTIMTVVFRVIATAQIAK